MYTHDEEAVNRLRALWTAGVATGRTRERSGRGVTVGPAGTGEGAAEVDWDELFRDLEAGVEAEDAAELAAEVRDRSRREAGRIHLRDRLRPVVGHPVALGCPGAAVRGRLRAVGPDWLLVSDDAGGEVLVVTAALLWVSGVGASAASPGSEGVVSARLDLRSALRALVRDRADVAVVLTDGTRLDGAAQRVGADYLELGPGGSERGWAPREGARLVPLTALALLRRR